MSKAQFFSQTRHNPRQDFLLLCVSLFRTLLQIDLNDMSELKYLPESFVNPWISKVSYIQNVLTA